MTLGALIVLTDRVQAARPLVEVVAAAVDAGASAIVLREKDLDRSARQRLADEMAPIVRRAGSLLISAGETLDGCDGVHHPSSPIDAIPGTERVGYGPVGAENPAGPVVGVSCHDQAEVESARLADYVTLSPIYPTASKPGYGPALGTEVLAQSRAAVPVYALGGITTRAQADECLAAGAAGVAVMGAVMRADAPDVIVRNLLAGVAA